MDINTKTRDELTVRFKKNMIPTEDDFADLINAAVNQKADGITRPQGKALCIEAATPEAANLHPVLNLYGSFADSGPAWVISLLAGDPAAGLKGFALVGGDERVRLSINPQSGELTIGPLTATGTITARDGIAIPDDKSLVTGALTASGMIDAKGGLTVRGTATVSGDLKMGKSMLSLGAPDRTTPAAAGEVVGAIGFYGFSQSHGQLSYRAGTGFELVDRSAQGDVPSLTYTANSKPYAALKAGAITAAGTLSCQDGARIDGDRATHLEANGAFYRTGSQVYLTVNDNLFVRRMADPAAPFHFDAKNRRLGVGKTDPTCALDVQGDAQATGKLTFGSELSSANGLFTVQMRQTAAKPDGKTFQYPMLHLKGLVRTGDVAARNEIRCTKLTVNKVAGDPARPGTLTCVDLVATSGIKQSQIDHPLDPKHKILAHASLDGPEVAVYYRGEGQLVPPPPPSTGPGRTAITLPAYFEALTLKEGRTVMITPRCGADDPISSLAATEIVDGRFTVRGIDARNPGQRFYWEVKAVRKDVPKLVVELIKKGTTLPRRALPTPTPPTPPRPTPIVPDPEPGPIHR